MKKLVVQLSAIFILIGFTSLGFADDVNPNPNTLTIYKKSKLKMLFSLSVGVSNNHAASTQMISSSETPPVLNTYTPNNKNTNNTFYSLFFGEEHTVNSIFDLQFGLGYYFIPMTNISGILGQSIGSATDPANIYNYQYSISSQQLLVEGKLLFKWRERIFPYLNVGLGGAMNHAGSYSATPQTETAGPSPWFASHDQTNFSYSLGLGVDMILETRLRWGLGYRYSNLGNLSLGAQDNSEVLINKNYYSHTLLTTLTYFF